LFARPGLLESPNAKYSRPDSKVWLLYLEEAAAEDKELVQMWKTGLNSLLVFVRFLIPHFLGANSKSF
jgi:hypothetical protein